MFPYLKTQGKGAEIWQKLEEVWDAVGFCAESKTHREEKQSNTEFHYHVCVHVFFAVDVGGGSSKLQQLMRLVDHQRGLELAQPEKVAAKHPAETKREQVRRKRRNKDLLILQHRQ